VVITLDPGHVRRLGVDDLTFFIEKPIENGIILEMHKLYSGNKIERRPDKFLDEVRPDRIKEDEENT
jgi:hypothetical protein